MADPLLVERYRITTLLGSGGMGTVWRAHDELLGRDVAVKRIELADDMPPGERAMLCARAAREARAAAMLDHPGIITVHDVVEPDERPWIVMELIEGRSLARAVVDDGPLPPRRVAHIGARLLDALSAAHAKGLLHRDVKPANVLLADDGRIVLTDFGIAALDGDATLTRTGALVGSPGFIAPERLREDEEETGPASDLWSLGATLYAAVEGRAPFERSTPLAALGAVLTEEPPKPERAGPLAPVLARLLDKNPATRISADEAATALRRVATGDDSGLRVRPRRYFAIAAITVAAVAAGTVPFLHGHGSPPARPSGEGHPVSSVDPCAVLTDQQANALMPGAVRRRNAPRDGDCAWLAPKMPATLSIYEPIAVAASFSAGRDQMAIKRTEVTGEIQASRSHPLKSSWVWPYDGFPKMRVHGDGTSLMTELTGVGDEAITYTYRGKEPYDDVNVVVREGNVVLELQWTGRRDGPDAAAVRARQAAVAVAATLARLQGRG